MHSPPIRSGSFVRELMLVIELVCSSPDCNPYTTCECLRNQYNGEVSEAICGNGLEVFMDVERDSLK